MLMTPDQAADFENYKAEYACELFAEFCEQDSEPLVSAFYLYCNKQSTLNEFDDFCYQQWRQKRTNSRKGLHKGNAE